MSKIFERVQQLRDVGRDVKVWGTTDDDEYALIVDEDNNNVFVAQKDIVSGLGRWECSPVHLDYYAESVYAKRFPKPAP